MPIRFYVDRDLRLVVAVHIGPVPDAEFLAAYEKLYADPDFDLSFDILVDLRKAESVSRSAAALQSLASSIVPRYERSKSPIKLVFVAKTDVSYGMSRMFQAFADTLPGESMVFRTMDEALDWLGAPPDAVDRLISRDD